jgi:hypothetical protein
MLTTVRWTARALEGIVAVYFLIYCIRGGVQAPSLLTTGEAFAVLGVALCFAGLSIAWTLERAGGGLIVAGYLLIAVSFSSILSMRMYHVLALSGVLSLAAWWLGDKAGKPVPPPVLPSALAEWFVRWQKPLAATGGVLVLLFLNELFLTPPLMSPGLRSDHAFAGRWEGRSAVRSGWIRQHKLKLSVNIDGEGAVTGGVGDAALSGGKIVPNRSWLGSLLGWRSDYMISGSLTGMVVAPESIARAEVRIPVTFRGERLVGCMLAMGGGGDSHGDLQCNRLSMFKPGPDRAVTFRVRPENIPEASSVYLTGDNDQFGNWEPAGAPLDRQSDGTWARTFRIPEGSVLSYNCTRGSWRTQALDGTGGALPNRFLEVRRDTTIVITVASWADIIM